MYRSITPCHSVPPFHYGAETECVKRVSMWDPREKAKKLEIARAKLVEKLHELSPEGIIRLRMKSNTRSFLEAVDKMIIPPQLKAVLNRNRNDSYGSQWVGDRSVRNEALHDERLTMHDSGWNLPQRSRSPPKGGVERSQPMRQGTRSRSRTPPRLRDLDLRRSSARPCDRLVRSRSRSPSHRQQGGRPLTSFSSRNRTPSPLWRRRSSTQQQSNSSPKSSYGQLAVRHDEFPGPSVQTTTYAGEHFEVQNDYATSSYASVPQEQNEPYVERGSSNFRYASYEPSIVEPSHSTYNGLPNDGSQQLYPEYHAEQVNVGSQHQGSAQLDFNDSDMRETNNRQVQQWKIAEKLANLLSLTGNADINDDVLTKIVEQTVTTAALQENYNV